MWTRAKRFPGVLESVIVTRSKVASMLVTLVVAASFTAQEPAARVELNPPSHHFTIDKHLEGLIHGGSKKSSAQRCFVNVPRIHIPTPGSTQVSTTYDGYFAIIVLIDNRSTQGS